VSRFGTETLALVRRLFGNDHAEECGLPGAVRTNEADFVTGIELEGGVYKKKLPPVLLVNAR
jgi:hypothetical protein